MRDQVVAAEGAFADDGGGLLFEPLALGGVEIHGGDDEHGGLLPLFGGAEAGEEFKAIDLGHHEIEHDDAGLDGRAFFEGFGAIGGFVDGPAEVLELAFEQAAGVWAVIDDQGRVGATGGGVAKNGAGQTIDIDGLGEDLVGEEAAGVAVGIEDAHEDDGDAGELGVGLEAAEDFPAVGAFHDNVECNDARVEHAGHAHAFFAVSGHRYVDGMFFEEAANEAVDGGVVIDDEHRRLLAGAEGRRGVERAGGKFFRQRQGERGADAGLRLDERVAAEHAGEALGDGQAESGSLPFAADGGGFELMERLEEAGDFFGGDAGAGVDDVEAEEGALAFDDAFDAEGDLAFLREFAGVGEQIQQALANFDDVGIHAADARREDDVERVAVLGGHGADEFDDLVDQFGDEEGGGVDFDFASLDFGHFEDGVDEFEEVFAGGLDLLEVLEIGGAVVGFGLFLEHLAVADDGV